MDLDLTYLATVINSVIRLSTPILFVCFTACICSKVGVFNIGLEGTMLGGAFAAIVTLKYTNDAYFSVLVAGLVGCALSFVLAVLIVKFKATPIIVGFGMNTLMSGTTTFLMTLIFGSKGVFYDSALRGLPKIALPGINTIPLLGKAFSSLTILDYMAFICAIALYIFMYKTVCGYRLRAIGINKEAARSLGTKVDRFQITAVTISGFFTGLGGALLTVASVVIFTQDISSGRGYIAMAANNLGTAHPLGVVAACAVFGLSEALGNMLQNTAIKSSLLDAIPYIVTIIALIVIYLRDYRKKTVQKMRRRPNHE